MRREASKSGVTGPPAGLPAGQASPQAGSVFSKKNVTVCASCLINPAPTLLEGVLAAEGGLGGARHEDAVVGLAPLDLEVAAGERHGARAVGLAGEDGGDGEGARAGAAREGRAGAALPDLSVCAGGVAKVRKGHK